MASDAASGGPKLLPGAGRSPGSFSGGRWSARAWLVRLVYRTPRDVLREIGFRNAYNELDEELIDASRHHWILLLRNLFLPVMVFLLCIVVFSFRAGGGDFLASGVVTSGEFDLANRLLAIGVLGVAFAWLFVPLGTSNRRRTRFGLLVLGLVLLGLFLFRYWLGGRVFYSVGVPMMQAFDGLNMLLALVMAGAVISGVYAVFDWLNDFLILTDKRVIYDDEKLFVRRVQDQLAIEDIQSVTSKTGQLNLFGYFSYFLNFGTVEVQSASFREPIVFELAHRPGQIQKKIDEAVKSLRTIQKQQANERIVNKIMQPEAQGASAPKPAAGPTTTTRFLGRVFGDNPSIAEDGTITWRRHWIFAVAALGRPTGALLFGLLVVYAIRQLGLEVVSLPWIIIALLLGILVFWVVWVLEDYRNDLYILKSNQVEDVEKLPFGPENRQSAPLGALQNVQMRTSFIGRIIGYGDVELETAGGRANSKLTFHGVPRPGAVVAQINQYHRNFRQGETERTLEATAALLAAFYGRLQQQNPDQ